MEDRSVRWTPAQRAAIETGGGNILVAAAAGTGKTAVLVERCLRLITRERDPVDVDRLLVVTFTEAAAAEMRNRIGRALRERIESRPADVRLRRQLILLDRASISTIHAFALRTIQEHFFQLGLDPNLGVMDPEEAALLRAETLTEVLESLYTDEDESGERFRRLIDRYGLRGDDSPVRRAILEVSAFLASLPWPRFWRDRMLAAFGSAETAARFEETDWCREMERILGDEISLLLAEARSAAEMKVGGRPLPSKYAEHFRKVEGLLEEMAEALRARGYEGLREAAAAVLAEYPDLPRLPRGSVDDALREEVKRRNKAIKNVLKTRIIGKFCAFSGERWLQTIRATRPDVETLLGVVDRFDAAYSQAKSERGKVDFNDLERFCFQLLLDAERSSPQRLVPSAVGRELRDRFAEVLVDEYQDINPLQDAILYLCSRQDEPDRPPNLFMVGDVKQSIYRFRLAEPEIFQEKFETYFPDVPPGAEGGSSGAGPDGRRDRRIDLTDNFRSRAPLLDALNNLFRIVFVPELGGIRYDEAAELRRGFDYPAALPPDLPPPSAGVPVEIHFFDRANAREERDEEGTEDSGAENARGEEAEMPEEIEQIEVEARWVGERIRAMVAGREMSVWDKAEGRYRPIAYKDIAVLLQTAAYKADLFVRVFDALGVPAYTEAESGALETTEILDLVNLLEILDNPHQDIAVAAVLRSPLFGLGEDDLARIRIRNRSGEFFSAVESYAERGADKGLRRRLGDFLAALERWRDMARRGPLARLLWTIYDETGYLDYVTAMPDGARRRANLIGLYDRARQFDEFSRRGLGRFLEFLRQLQETETELAATPALSEADDVVRVMSIHKSKGLEFPVVFVPDIGKKFNLADTKSDVVLDRRRGIAIRDVIEERGIKYPSAAYLVVANRAKREALAEKLRLLYVATTRAREKLILCGSVELASAVERWASRRGPSGSATLDPAAASSAQSFADWIGPALARLGCLPEGGDGASEASAAGFRVVFHGAAERPAGGVLEAERDPEQRRLLAKMAALEPVEPPPHDRELVGRIADRLQWRYRWERLAEVKGKFSVTELKRRFDAVHEADELAAEHLASPTSRRPRFLLAAETKADKAKLTAAEIGTAYHTVLRHVDLERSPSAEAVGRQVSEMVAAGLLSPAEAKAVEPEIIVRFLRSRLGEEMRRRATHVLRELPFSLAVPAVEIERDLPEEIARGELVHVQGVIDCLIERPEGFVLLDFKTDRVGAGEAAERAERYRTQMEFYARAVEAIFGRRVVERVVFFLRAGVEVSV